MPLSAAARFRYSLAAGSTAVVIGAGFLAAGMARGDTESPGATSVNAPLAAAGTSAAPSEGDLLSSPAATGTASEPAQPPSAAASPSASASSRSASPKVPVKTTASPAAAKKAGAAAVRGSAPVTSGTVAEQVLAHINAARVADGLKALTLDTNLSKAAAVHTQLMIDGCGLSHQCPGEAGLGERFSAQNVKWGTAGENIGYGSSGSSDSAMVKAANGLTDSMLAEVPPNDGHRKNLLNKSFTRIGLSIVRDAKGVTWMTQDFVG
ncbi:CAP domain-containing protein [Actinoplanes sp. NEAU-A12]|uniref:CAP domain-containing protein n=1 Tax=Actinoplanes sandaracinus TaxID=3045177 RepID=A0ABT6WUR8_9ACTN|nr:CAP domain-containing protein [Actinoplanes sandaracinus]MDI6103493.1 CAP domain-containing protein [Actinoplanes sandaracinus]